MEVINFLHQYNMKRNTIFIAIATVVISIAIAGILIFLPNCSASDPLTESVYLTDLHSERVFSDEITLGGAPLLIPAYGELYITAPVAVECTLADTFYLVSGVTTSGELHGFENNGFGRITYTDVTSNRVCLVNASITVTISPPDVPTTISVQLFKNGVADTPSLVQDLISVSDQVDALPMVSLVTLLNTGDYLEVYISSSKAGANVVINTMSIITTTVD